MNAPNFPMRSGHAIGNNVQEPTNWNDVQTIMALMCVFNEQAFKDGVEYAKAAGRDTVLAEDYLLGLKFNAVPSTGFYTSTENLTEKVAEWRNNEQLGNMVHMAMGGEDRFPSDDEEEEEEEDDLITEEEIVWTRGPEDNELVRRMHAAEQEYDNWSPSPDQFEAVAVKRAIDRAILQYEFTE